MSMSFFPTGIMHFDQRVSCRQVQENNSSFAFDWIPDCNKSIRKEVLLDEVLSFLLPHITLSIERIPGLWCKSAPKEHKHNKTFRSHMKTIEL
jgi:hypothetical protein